MFSVAYRVFPELIEQEKRVESFFILLTLGALLGWALAYFISCLQVGGYDADKAPSRQVSSESSIVKLRRFSGVLLRPLSWGMVCLAVVLAVLFTEGMMTPQGRSLIDLPLVRPVAVSLATWIGGVINLQRLTLLAVLVMFGGPGWCVFAGQLASKWWRPGKRNRSSAA